MEIIGDTVERNSLRSTSVAVTVPNAAKVLVLVTGEEAVLFQRCHSITRLVCQ